MSEAKLSIPAQIKIALDGRTQRTLALDIKMPEHDLSRKMNGIPGWEFTEDEILRIEERLKCKIDREPVVNN